MIEKRETYYFSNALGYTFEQLAEMHNISFSGYFMPATMIPAQVADFWRINQIDATRCVVMHDADNAFVGMARMGARGTRGWCGGFGIAPAFRGTGASKLLAHEMVRVARETGLTQLQLEVLCQNSRAIKLYEHVGFVTHRRLFGLEIATSDLPTRISSTPSLQRVSSEMLLPLLQQHTARPCWSCELASVLVMDHEILVAPSSEGRLNAFIVHRFDGKIRLQTALLQSDITDDEFAALLHAAAADASLIQIFNEPGGSPFIHRYLSLGFTEFFRQHEMLLNL